MNLSFAKHTLGFIAVLLAAGLSAECRAEPINPAISFTTPQGDSNAGAFSLGFTFTTNVTITVNQLGIFDDGTQAGSTRPVGIFDPEGDLLTSTTITQGTNLSNFFDWASINPLTLTAGHQYYIAEWVQTSNYAFANFPFMTVNPDITFLGSATTLTPATGLEFPGHFNGLEFGFFGPNFSIAAASVSEAPSLPIFLIGLGLLGAFSYRRKRSLAT